MSDRDIVWLHGQIDLLSERVSKLDKEREELHKRCDALSDAVGRLEQDALDPKDQP